MPTIPRGSSFGPSGSPLFESMVDCANQENCDLFVVAGDLLERTKRIAQQDIKQLVHILSRFHGTVVILLGTHDYYSPAEVGGVLGLALHFAAKEKKDG